MHTQSEIQKELEYRYLERIAILCGSNEPTKDQHDLAMREVEDFKRELVLARMRGKNTQ